MIQNISIFSLRLLKINYSELVTYITDLDTLTICYSCSFFFTHLVNTKLN